MPINQILAAYYVRVSYQTWASAHNLTLYLGDGVLTPTTTDYQLSLASIPSNPSGSIALLVKDVFDVFYSLRNIFQPIILSIDLFQSASGPNVYVGPITPVQPAAGALQGTASSYLTVSGIAQSSSITRQSWRITLFETVVNPAPQRFTENWSSTSSVFYRLYEYADALALVSQDGAKLTMRTYNVGYNRRLARRYGRLIAP